MKIDIDVFCNECGEELEIVFIEGVFNGGHLAIMVNPCKECAKEEKEDK